MIWLNWSLATAKNGLDPSNIQTITAAAPLRHYKMRQSIYETIIKRFQIKPKNVQL